MDNNTSCVVTIHCWENEACPVRSHWEKTLEAFAWFPQDFTFCIFSLCWVCFVSFCSLPSKLFLCSIPSKLWVFPANYWTWGWPWGPPKQHENLRNTARLEECGLSLGLVQDKEFIRHKVRPSDTLRRTFIQQRQRAKYLWVKLKTETKQIKRDFPETMKSITGVLGT